MLSEDDDGKLTTTARLPHLKTYTYGDWKTIEGVRKYVADLYAHATWEGGSAGDEEALLKASETLIPIHGDLHVGFHILDAIYRLSFDCSLDPVKTMLGMKRITSDPMKSGIFAAKELLKICHGELKLHFLQRFLSEPHGKAALESVRVTAPKLEQALHFGREFQEFLDLQCLCMTDAVLQFHALLLKATDLLLLHDASTKRSDAVSLYKFLIESMPLFQTSGKPKYVNLCFSWMEVAAEMRPAELLEEFINHTVNMNKGKHSIAMDRPV